MSVMEVLLECHIDILGELHVLEHPLQLEGEAGPALRLQSHHKSCEQDR